MKSKLNRIKKREYFRPFAPIVRLDDVTKYFNWRGESRCMNFSCTVKAKYKIELSSIIHADKTSRVQTITRKQNRFLYDLLTEMDNQNILPVLINTSFNIQGKPILNSYKDAFHMLDHTALDHLIIINEYTKKDGAIFTKRLRGIDF
jgi:carbamoyltransferase